MSDDDIERDMRLSGLTEPEEVALDCFEREWNQSDDSRKPQLPLCGIEVVSMESSTRSRVQIMDGVPF